MTRSNLLVLVSIVALATVAIACGDADSQDADSRLITPGQVTQQLEMGGEITFIDVRGETSFEAGHIPEAIVVTLEDARVDDVPVSFKSRVVTYCNGNGLSGQVADTLLDNGFTDVYVLDGGFGAWQAEGLPVATIERDDVASPSPKERGVSPE